MSRYDEDLYENPFFMLLERQHTQLFDEATANRWIICIPRYSTVKVQSLTKKDFQDHILQPLTGDVYKSVSGCEVSIKGGQISLEKGFPDPSLKVKVLFEETFYNSKDESYRVLCLSGFFNRKPDSVEASIKEENLTKPPSNYEDCLNILWRNAGSSKTKENFDKTLTGFCVQYQKLDGGSIEALAEMVSGQLTQAMQTVLKDQNIRRSVQTDEAFMTNLKLAVEMYMMNAVHKHLFSAVQLYTKSADATINKKTRNLVDIRLHQLGVRKEFEGNLPAAKKEMAMLNQYSTPMGRMLCLKRVFTAISKPLKEESDIVMTTDDLLPLLIYLIIKSQIPNWSTNLMYMKHFQQVTLMDKDEISFYLATVEAALNYISSDTLRADSRQFSPQKVSRPAGNHEVQLNRQISGGSTSTKEKFFQYVQYGDEAAVRLMLQKSDLGEEDISSKLCHPLCDCVKCTEILLQNKQKSNKFSINARDDMGRIALHIAAFYGQASLIDILVKKGALTDATDYMGCTPLHLACQKGYQNIILLLVHFGSDISALDNEGNTPLHLCAKNGHEDCVKAILFLDILKNKLNVNAKNDMGDAPLHLAAKWGYEGIVRFLLESEANPLTRNRKRQTPLDVAQNPSIKHQLQTACDEPLPVMVPYPGPVVDPPPPTPTQPPSVHSSHISNRRPSQSNPDTISGTVKAPQDYVVIEKDGQVKSPVQLVDNSSETMMAPTSTPVTNLNSVYLSQIEKLYKAIRDKDLPLIKFYMGWSESEESDEEDSPTVPEVQTLCHPLCQCSKCHPLQKVSGRTSLTVNCQNKKGFAPLHISVIERNMDAFRLFLRHGANVNLMTGKNVTALHLACFCSDLEMTKTLIKYGAKVNAVDLHGEIPIHLACAKRNPHIVLFLVECSSQVNKANIMGNTPLHLATSHNTTEVVRILLDHGADLNVKNKQGQLPYQLTKSLDVQKLLIKKQGELKAASTHELSTPGTAETTKTGVTVPMKHSTDTLKSDSKLFEDIKSFSKTQSLKKSKTFDHSTALLDSPELKLSLSIKSFDKSMCLKHSKTLDRSQSFLQDMKRNFAIQSFDSLALRHVDLVDKSSPLHLYYLAQSSYKDYEDEITVKPVVDSDKMSEDSSYVGDIPDEIHTESSDVNEIDTNTGTGVEKLQSNNKENIEEIFTDITTDVEKIRSENGIDVKKIDSNKKENEDSIEDVKSLSAEISRVDIDVNTAIDINGITVESAVTNDEIQTDTVDEVNSEKQDKTFGNSGNMMANPVEGNESSKIISNQPSNLVDNSKEMLGNTNDNGVNSESTGSDLEIHCKSQPQHETVNGDLRGQAKDGSDVNSAQVLNLNSAYVLNDQESLEGPVDKRGTSINIISDDIGQISAHKDISKTQKSLIETNGNIS